MRTLLLLVCSYPFFVCGQSTVAGKALTITKMAANYHVSPRLVNDSFSLQVFRTMMEKMDPFSVYFTAEEYAQLQTAALGIDEGIAQQSTAFLQTLRSCYAIARKRFIQQAQTILAKPLSFTTKEYFQYNNEADAGKPIAQPQPQRAQAYLKWRVLTELSTHANDSGILTPALVQQHVMGAQKNVLAFFEKRYATFTGDSLRINKWLEESYLSAIAEAYDPHTAYMSRNAYDELESSLSSESMAFGFDLTTTNDGNLKITDVLPGSAAWQSSNIHEGDVIIAIKPEGEAAITVANATPEQLNALFEKYADKTVEFTIKAADGTTRVVKLKKQAVRNEENVVRGWILDGQPKIGFISLPSFYTETNDGIGTSCAEDVAREIVKLKQEKIEGMILDLRFNGGGSMEEAASMLGIFVDIGPLGAVKTYEGKAEPIKDINRGTIYDGPLVVMVNGASASASEMLAATLQDYRKAVIVGSTTFGKATMQIVLPLLENFDINNFDLASLDKKSNGDFLKITIGKLYRVNGTTAQNRGVVPDVYLPDYFEVNKYTERSFANALPADSIALSLPFRPMPEKYNRSSFQAFEKSSVANDTAFVQLRKNIQYLMATNTGARIPLLLSEFNRWNKDESESTDESRVTPSIPYKVANTRLDASYNSMDSFQQENDAMIIEELSEDPWLKQVYLLFKNVLIR